MEITLRFAKVIKLLLLFTVIMFVYSFSLAYFGIEGISISNPEDNTTLRVVLNKLKGIILSTAFWGIIGYLTKDIKAAIAAFIISIAFRYGIAELLPSENYGAPKTLYYYMMLFSSILPYLVFGAMHFRSKLAFQMIVFWAIIWGLSITHYGDMFERLLSGLIRIFGVRDPFEFRVSTDTGGYRPINVFRLVHSQFILILQISVFWWIYQVTRAKKSIWDSLHMCYVSTSTDRVSFSGIYWGLRLTLFVSGMGLVGYIANTFKTQFEIISLLRIIIAALALFFVGSIYRNFLVSIFAKKGKYPGGLFFLLNVPFVNIFAWLYMLINFNATEGDSTDINKLKEKFVKSGRNGGWKIIVIIFSIFTGLFQLNSAGFRVDGPSRNGAFIVLTFLVIAICLLLWFLYDKNSYIPILILMILGLVVATIARDGLFIQPAMAMGIINLSLFYGMFYFDELEWVDNQTLE